MRIGSLEINNILSIEHAKLIFGDAGLVLLDGWNYDDDSANGAGKTAVFNALSFGLFGKLPRKISASDVLRQGTKAGSVKVEVEEAGITYTVVRHRPNNLEFFIDGVKKDITQEAFEQYINLNYQQYLISMYSAQTEGMKLISMNDSGKKDFFLQLLNLEQFSEYKKASDSKIKELVLDTQNRTLKLAKLESKVSVHKETMEDEDEIRDQIAKLDPTPLLEQLKELEKIEKPDTSKYDEIEVALKTALVKIFKRDAGTNNIKSQLVKLKAELQQVEKSKLQLDQSVVCPHCDGKFELSENGETLTLEKFAKHKKETVADLKGQIEVLETEYQDLQTDESKNDIEERLTKINSKKSKHYADYNKSIIAINEMRSKISNRNHTIASLRKNLNNIANTRAIIEDLSKQIRDENLALKSNNDTINLYETISHIFSPVGAPAYIMDSLVDTFNEKISHYVSMIWANASYSIQSFKENKSGEIKAKFSELLTVSGTEKSIGMLSGGEHRCLSLAVDFAVVDVLETICGTKLNPIMLDEPFNDLDASNRERVLELLEKISTSRQIWVIDHASEAKAMFSNVVRIEKRDGISAIA